jgi:hypothetical protein
LPRSRSCCAGMNGFPVCGAGGTYIVRGGGGRSGRCPSPGPPHKQPHSLLKKPGDLDDSSVSYVSSGSWYAGAWLLTAASCTCCTCVIGLSSLREAPPADAITRPTDVQCDMALLHRLAREAKQGAAEQDAKEACLEQVKGKAPVDAARLVVNLQRRAVEGRLRAPTHSLAPAKASLLRQRQATFRASSLSRVPLCAVC